MARFPDLYPAGRAAGPFPPQPPFPPGTGPGIGTVSFTRRPVSGSATIDALMRRQRDMAERQAALATQAYPGMGTITGGLGNMVNQFTAGLAEHRAREEEAAGRAELAQALSGIDQSTGIATPEQLATIYSRDPDTGLALMQNAIETRRAQRAAELAATQRIEERGWSVEDREDAQRAAAELAAARQPQFRPMTAEDYKAWGITVNPETGLPDTPYRFNVTEGKPEGIGGGAQVQLMPAEIGARVGMSDVFQERYPDIIREIDAGNVAGPVDYFTGVAGQGRVGEVHRQIKSGVDALVRNLTGAGKSESEARDYASRYLPQLWDTTDSLKSKVVGLNEELTGVRSTVTRGRNAPEAPDTTVPEAAPSADEEATLQAARDAIAAGKSRKAVEDRLRQNGIDPGRL